MKEFPAKKRNLKSTRLLLNVAGNAKLSFLRMSYQRNNLERSTEKNSGVFIHKTDIYLR